MDKEALAQSVTDQEQRSFVKIGKLIGWSSGEIHRWLVSGLEGKALGLKTVEYWVTKMNKGRTDIEDTRGRAYRVAPDKDQRIDRIKLCFRETRAWSVAQLSLEVNVPPASLWRILTDELGLKKIMGKFVPHLLSEDQKMARSNICHDNLIRVKRHPRLLRKTLAIDESWVKLYSAPRKDQMRHWLETSKVAPNVVADELRTPKRMLILAMNFEEIAFWHLCKERETVNSEVYRSFLQTYVPKWMEGKPFKGPVILHDGASCHRSRVVKKYLEENNFNTWTHPPYSLHLYPCDYNCFGLLKQGLAGIRFPDWESFEEKLESEIQRHLRLGHFQGVAKLPDRWQSVEENEGNYI